MSQNEDLLDLVEDFALTWGFERFADPAALDSDIADLLYEWAGVTGGNPDSRGGNIDARQLGFLEAYFGEEFRQWGYNPNPRGEAAAVLEQSWDKLVAHLRPQLIVQAGASTLFGILFYTIWLRANSRERSI